MIELSLADLRDSVLADWKELHQPKLSLHKKNIIELLIYNIIDIPLQTHKDRGKVKH